jgi:ankyrin repeat protein
MESNQGHIINVFNQYLREKNQEPLVTQKQDTNLYLNPKGVCLALALCHLNAHFYYNTDQRTVFHDFLRSMSSEEGIKKLFKHADSLKKYREGLIKKFELTQNSFYQSQINRYDLYLRQQLDKLAMIDLLLSLHAEQTIEEKNFYCIDMHASFDPQIASYAGLFPYASVGLTFTKETIHYLFQEGHPLCPFTRGGAYLLCLKNHAMSLIISQRGLFEFYDPNLDWPLRIIKKTHSAMLYNAYQSNDLFEVAIFAIKPKSSIRHQGRYDLFLQKNHKIEAEERVHGAMSKTAAAWLKGFDSLPLRTLKDKRVFEAMFFTGDLFIKQKLREMIKAAAPHGWLNELNPRGESLLCSAIIAAYRTQNIAVIQDLLATDLIDMSYCTNGFNSIDLLMFLNEAKLLKLFLAKPNFSAYISKFCAQYLNKRIENQDFDLAILLLPELGRRIFFESTDYSALVYAITYQLNTLASFLINDHGIDVNESSKGTTPLMHAIALDNIEIAAHLIKNETIRLNDIINGMTALDYSIIRSAQDIVKLLIEDERVDVTLSPTGITPLEQLIIKNDLDMVVLLLNQKRVCFNFSIVILDHLESKLAQGDSFMSLLLLNHPKTAEYFKDHSSIKLEADDSIRLQRMAQLLMPRSTQMETMSFFYPPLIEAICVHDIDRVANILTYEGLDLTQRDDDNKTPFFYAVQQKNTCLISLFLTHQQVQLHAIKDPSIIELIKNFMAQKDESSCAIALLLIEELNFNINTFFPHGVDHELLHLLYLSHQNFLTKKIMETMIQHSPTFFETLLRTVIDEIIHFKLVSVNQKSLHKKQRELLIMIQALKDFDYLHTDLVLPPELERVFKRIQKEQPGSFKQAFFTIGHCIDQNLLAIQYREGIVQTQPSVQEEKESSATLQSYLQKIPDFFSRTFGGMST